MWRKIVGVGLVLTFVGTAMATVRNADVLRTPVPLYKKAKVSRVRIFKKTERLLPLKTAKSVKRFMPKSRVPRYGVLQKGDSLYYYNAVDSDAIGLTQGGTYQAAIKLTPSELSSYGGWAITQVLFYHHETGTHSGQIIVYAAGTDTTPGDIITSVPYTASGSGWIVVNLPSPGVLIDPNSDLWIAVEITHQQGEYPISVDNGPAVPGKGDWVYSPGAIPWAELRNLSSSLDLNWDIAAIVEPSGDSLDPLPPTNLTAYSDYTTPTSIALSWSDPTHYFGGDTLTDFHIEVWKIDGNDTTFVDSVSAGVETDTVTGLTDGTLYTFLVRAVDTNDSTSPFVSTSWYSGGSPYPAPPTGLVANVVDESTVELTWINPSTQSDGTPLDDLAGINIYVDDSLTSTYSTNIPGQPVTDTITVTPGHHDIYVTAFDNETPVHESDPSNVVEVITNVHTGGPDGYGYTFMDSDYPGGPVFNWIDATSGTQYNLGDDDNVSINLPFSFPFYDQTLTQIYVVSNGFLSSSSTTDFSNDPLPDNNKNNIIAPFWDDLDPSSGGSVYTYSDPTTGAFVIEWYQVPHCCSGGPYTFEVILYPNGDMKFQYLDMDEGRIGESTVGIQGGDGSNNHYLQYTYNGDPLTTHDSLAIYWRYPAYNHDVGVTGITEPVPGGSYQTGNVITPVVNVTNFGGSTETFAVTAEIFYGDSSVYTSTANVTLNSGENTDVTFDNFTVNGYGLYQFVAYTSLAGDENPNNDTLSCNFTVAQYSEDFEANDGGFTAEPSTGAWEWGTPTAGPSSAHSGTNLWGTVLGGDYSNSADWYLYTPDLIATSDNPVFTFWHWYDIETGFDGGNVEISTDGGSTWTLIEPEGGYPDSSISGLNQEPGYTGHDATWRHAMFILNGINSGTIFKIRFHFGSDASVTYPGWYIDDVSGVGLTPYLPNHDVGVIQVVSPVGAIIPGNTIDVVATVRNFGVNEETFDVTAVIYSHTKDTVFTQTTNVTLASLTSTNVNFGSFTPDSNKYYHVVVYTSLTGDENPDNDTATAEARTALSVGDIVYILPLDPITGDNQNLGVEFDGQYFYVTGGNTNSDPNKVYVIDPNGTLVCTVDQPSHSTGWGWRDLAFDGDTLYASVDNNVDKFHIDPAAGTLTYYGNFAGPENPNRALALNRDNGHFFTANFNSNIYEFDKTNPSINTWQNSYSIYGAAYDPSTHTIWFSTQETNSYGYNNMLYEFDPTTGSYTGNTIEFPLPDGWTDGMAGGLTIANFHGQRVLFELIQGDPVDFIAGIYLGRVGIREDETSSKALSYNLSLKQNPIYRSGELTFSVPRTSDVNISLYNVSGRLIKTLANGRFKAGIHHVILNANNLSSGIYFVRMNTGDYVNVKKVILIK